MAEKSSIMEFMDEVLPQKSIKFPKGEFIIKAMDAETIIASAPTIKELINTLIKQGVTADNFQEPDYLQKVIFTVIGNFLPFLSDATSIVLKDLKKLPPAFLLEIVTATIEVNAQSKDTLVKNWNSLVETGKKLGLVVHKEETAPKSVKSSKS